MSKRVQRVILLAAALAALPRPAITASQCVEYGPTSLTGTLVRQTYPGPPDYESVTKGDEPRTIWILQLEVRTCVYSPERTFAYRPAEGEVQLVLDADQYAQYQKFFGKQLIVTGHLIPGGARHEKRLVLVVAEMKKAPAVSSNEYLYAPNCRC